MRCIPDRRSFDANAFLGRDAPVHAGRIKESALSEIAESLPEPDRGPGDLAIQRPEPERDPPLEPKSRTARLNRTGWFSIVSRLDDGSVVR